MSDIYSALGIRTGSDLSIKKVGYCWFSKG